MSINPKINLGTSHSNISIGRAANITDIEKLLHQIQLNNFEDDSSAAMTLKLATHKSSGILSDIWTAMAVGTICRHCFPKCIVKAWGINKLREDFEETEFAKSLPGLVAIQMARSVISDNEKSVVDQSRIEQIISRDRFGIFEASGGKTRTLCEFDPQQPLALALSEINSATSIEDRHRLFRHLILQFRANLEIGGTKRKISPVDAGPVRYITTFLNELHDNAFEHGRMDPSKQNKLRFLRFKKHISTNRDDLLERASQFIPLYEYLSEVTRGAGAEAIIEASVSDFGLGIIDHFLNSDHGTKFTKTDRRSLLDNILLEKLSAKGGDPGAGQGISKALVAAKRMSAFVSLRTGEFWVAQSYADPNAPVPLQNVQQQPVAPVIGTHWQIILPQPL